MRREGQDNDGRCGTGSRGTGWELGWTGHQDRVGPEQEWSGRDEGERDLGEKTGRDGRGHIGTGRKGKEENGKGFGTGWCQNRAEPGQNTFDHKTDQDGLLRGKKGEILTGRNDQ